MYPGLKMSFEHIGARKNAVVSAWLYWNARLSSREMDQKLENCGTIGYGDSHLEFMFCQINVLRIYAILHDAAGALRTQNYKSQGYCYMIGGGPKSCVLVHVTRLLRCLYIELSLPAIFKSFDY